MVIIQSSNKLQICYTIKKQSLKCLFGCVTGDTSHCVDGFLIVLDMFSRTIILLFSMLRLACSNYKDYDPNLIVNSDSCEENDLLESDCQCYDTPANDFEYNICNQPNPGT